MTRSITLAVVLISICSTIVLGEVREWTDSTGAFKVKAELVEALEDTVRLKRTDGVVIDVPFARLSEADRRYVQSVNAKSSDGGPRGSGSSVEAIEAALEKQVVVEFIDTPLADVVKYLSDFSRILILLDSRAMDDVGVGAEAPITMNARADLGEVLDSMLKRHDLTWTVRNEVLQITTPVEAEYRIEPRVYRLQKRLSFDQLIADITRNIKPKSWQDVGGHGTIAVLPEDILVIRQSYRTHRLIARHYADVLEPISPAEQFPIFCQVDDRLKTSLFQKTQIDFIDAPLTDVVEFLKNLHNVPIVIDGTSLEDVGIGTDVPITQSLKGVQLRSGLTLLLNPLDLRWQAAKSEIRISTPEAAERELELVSYRVDDVITRQQTDAMLELVTSTIGPTTWAVVGGPGSVRFGDRGTLDVRQTLQMHMQLARLLEDLRRARKPR